jgi:hypothetical protein
VTNKAKVTACWNDHCVAPAVPLTPTTRASRATCSGDRPDSACSARAIRTGGKSGFATIQSLPTSPVTVTLQLNDQTGKPVLDKTMRVTPEPAYPNGRDCGAAGPQAQLVVDASGSVHEQQT